MQSFDLNFQVYNCCMDYMSRGTIFSVCSHTFILFWLRKTSVSVKTYQLNFCVFFWFGLLVPFIQRPLHFFGKFHLLILFFFLYGLYIRIWRQSQQLPDNLGSYFTVLSQNYFLLIKIIIRVFSFIEILHNLL